MVCPILEAVNLKAPGTAIFGHFEAAWGEVPNVQNDIFSGSVSEEQEKTLQMMKMILPGYTQEVAKQRNSVSYGLIASFFGI